MADLIETDRGSFFVEQTGPRDAPTIMFVAGLGDDHESWGAPIQYLRDRYRCVTFDNRGIGLSVVSEGPYSTRELAEDAQAVAERLGLRSVVAVGSSMGGAICQEWALAHPEMIDRLVLSNTWVGQDVWFSALIEHWIQLAVRGAGADVLYQLALFCFSPDHLGRNPGTIEEFLATPMPDLTGFVAAARACQSHDALGRVGSINVPTLIIGGDYDILTRPDLSRALATAMPWASLTWLSTGHMTFWERPQEWARLVADFVAEA